MEQFYDKIKTTILLSLVCALSLISCNREDELNISKLRSYNGKGFVISSIQYGPDDQVYCLGTLLDTDSALVLKYDEHLQLKDQVILNDIVEDLQNARLTYLGDRKWFLSNVNREYPFTTLNVYILDENFSVVKEKELMRIQNPNNAYKAWINVYSQPLVSNGDILLACDTINWIQTQSGGYGNNTGISIFRMNEDLSQSHAVFHGEKYVPGRLTYPYFDVSAIELNDASIFYYFYTYDQVISGILEKNGKLRYQNSRRPEYPQSSTNSLSLSGDNVVLNTTVNNSQRQHYNILNPNSGLPSFNTSLPLHVVNNGVNGPNPLPEKLNGSSGHIMFSEDQKKLYFYSITEPVSPRKKFELSFPDFDKMLSYRQLIKLNGNIIAGVSYQKGGKINFNLREVNANGEVVD